MMKNNMHDARKRLARGMKRKGSNEVRRDESKQQQHYVIHFGIAIYLINTKLLRTIPRCRRQLSEPIWGSTTAERTFWLDD